MCGILSLDDVLDLLSVDAQSIGRLSQRERRVKSRSSTWYAGKIEDLLLGRRVVRCLVLPHPVPHARKTGVRVPVPHPTCRTVVHPPVLRGLARPLGAAGVPGV